MKNELSDLVGKIYDASIDSNRWQNILEDMTTMSDCASFCFIYKDPRLATLSLLSYGVDPEAEKAFNDHYYKLDKSFDLAMEFCNTEGHLISTKKLLQNKQGLVQGWGEEYYNDFLYGMMGVDEVIGTVLNKNPDEFSLLGIHQRADKPIIEDQKLAQLQLLMPHFIRAQNIAKKLVLLDEVNKSVYESFNNLKQGVIFFDSLGKPLFINTSAENMLVHHPELGMNHRGIHCQSHAENLRLDQMLTQTILTSLGKSVSGGGNLLIGNNGLTKPLSIMLSPINSKDDSPFSLPDSVCAMMLINNVGEEIPPNQQRLSELYKLTPSEANVATAIANGKSLDEIASINMNSIHTVRNQLKSIFSKTDTHRQTELAKLVLGTLLIS